MSPGDFVLVKPGEVIPADGKIVEGRSLANESLLTGESKPVAKQVGDAVTGGAINTDSPLVVRVEQVGEGTRLSAIIQLMERAAAEKPRIVELADRVASRFVAVLLIVAALAALVWYWIAPDKALWIMVSVLVVTCPCALSLATPIALTVGAGALAKDGLLVTRGHAIETLARATHFVFDKTGTLTTGDMRLLDVLPLAGTTRETALDLAIALEQGSEHPLAQALRRERVSEAVAVDLCNQPGSGVEGGVAGTALPFGTPRLCVGPGGRLAG